MKSTMDFFPVIKTRLGGVTKNGKDTPENCCRYELMDRENAPNEIFLCLGPSLKTSIDKRNFDEQYGKSFYGAIEKFKASVSFW